MSRDVKYIGMDTHKEAIVIAVRDASGKLREGHLPLGKLQYPAPRLSTRRFSCSRRSICRNFAPRFDDPTWGSRIR
jgi:hypothetical protein